MVKEWKKEEVAKLKERVEAHKTVGVAGIREISARQLQQIRRDLKDKITIKVAKNSLITRALAGSKHEGLIPYVQDQTALIFTNLDAFKLYKILEEGKTPAPIKAGAVAPCDIVVEKGPTPFKPGPIVGELQNVGIPATIEGGKIVVKETTVVVKEGERVPPKIAEILKRLEIYPVKVGLDLRAACDEDGVTYTPDLLRIDEEKYFADLAGAVGNAYSLLFAIRDDYPTSYTAPLFLTDAARAAYALAVEARYPTKETIEVLLQDACHRALSLAVEACTYEKEAMPFILARAYLYSQALAKIVEGR
ncbi:MAG: 50S ribosomal protein L10 [Candidatus Alkanophagales archaeon]|nr:MAG: 50S ribosomal protein L10 [Candidatus Alkanophagales archaeon]